MKNWKLSLVGLASISGFLLSGVEVEAATTATLNGSGEISYLENTTHPPLVDPENPGEPGGEIVTVPPKEGTAGPLSIDYVSDFQFDTQLISGNDERYYSKLTTIADKDGSNQREVPNFIQITDNRGNNMGWSLSVRQNGQLTSQTTNAELTGAAITIHNLTSDAKNNDGSNGPVLASSAINNQFTLNPNGAVTPLLVASENQGFGTWVTLFGERDNPLIPADTAIELTVPGSAKKEKAHYTTELSWILSDEPSN
ncbi:WxL domain-containing protein [Carnobacterium sp.]|uniref:WxL domain-containing protein n=1 Tax=Carnobacterium sp. TaxID=48221 RepID=UPI002FCA5E4C